MEIRSRKKIIVVGDKVLIAPEEDSDRTEHGLYLPPSDKEKEKVRAHDVALVKARRSQWFSRVNLRSTRRSNAPRARSERRVITKNFVT